MPRRPLTGPDDPRHGTYAGYLQEYRAGGVAAVCERCRVAEREYRGQHRRKVAYGQERKAPAEPVRAQLQGLMALGWSGEYLAERLGVYRNNLLPRYPTLSVRYAEAVAALYAELSTQQGPSERTRLRARKSGWVAPLGARSRQETVALIRRAEQLGTPPAVTQRYLKIDAATYAALREDTT